MGWRKAKSCGHSGLLCVGLLLFLKKRVPFPQISLEYFVGVAGVHVRPKFSGVYEQFLRDMAILQAFPSQLGESLILACPLRQLHIFPAQLRTADPADIKAVDYATGWGFHLRVFLRNPSSTGRGRKSARGQLEVVGA